MNSSNVSTMTCLMEAYYDIIAGNVEFFNATYIYIIKSVLSYGNIFCNLRFPLISFSSTACESHLFLASTSFNVGVQRSIFVLNDKIITIHFFGLYLMYMKINHILKQRYYIYCLSDSSKKLLRRHRLLKKVRQNLK